MQLTEFIPRILGFAEKTEKQLDSLAKVQADNADLKAANVALQSRLTTTEARVASVTVEVDAAKATIATQAAEIVTLKAAVETEKRRANDVIAGQGLDPGKLPSTSPNPPTGIQKPKNITEECLAERKATIAK